MNHTLHIGFDDTDSRKGMCTTFLAYKIVDYLKKERVKFLDYPYLVRFNPNIPWKTRGNGAVALKIMTEKPRTIKKKIIDYIKRYSATDEGANPGVVFYEKEEIPEHFSEFGKKALCTLVGRKKAKEFASKNNIDTFYIGNGQGLVGAIGAIGYRFRDHTFELLSYRQKSNFGKKRKIIAESVKKMQEITYPHTFNSYDSSKDRVLFAPHGPDPVLFGIRGENIQSVIKGASLVKIKEDLSGYMIFRSNQGTGDHLQNELDIKNIKPFSAGYLVGRVLDEPRVELGGHVLFSIAKEGKKVVCAVYKPTGLGNIATKLIKGDEVRVGGGIRKASKNHEQVLNVEFLEVLKLEGKSILVNPLCKRCNKRSKSKGRGQGYECIKCGKRFKDKVTQNMPRNIEEKLYLPVMSAHRHLTRPEQRLDRFNTTIEFDDSKKWFFKMN